MLTKGAIGNLINRYKAVLKKCHLINTFGSLAVASMLVLGGTGVAGATQYINGEGSPITVEQSQLTVDGLKDKARILGGWYITSTPTDEQKAELNSNITVNGGILNDAEGGDKKQTGFIFGGHYVSDLTKKKTDTTVHEFNTGTTNVVINAVDTVQAEYVIGGTGMHNSNVMLTGTETNVTINGGVFGKNNPDGNVPEQYITGGDNLKQGGSSIVTSATSTIDTTNITINDGKFNAAIVGGSNVIEYYAASAGEMSAKVGTANININGGEFNHAIVGGGFTWGGGDSNTPKYPNYKGVSSTVDKVVMNIDGTSGNLSINENIYAGGMQGDWDWDGTGSPVWNANTVGEAQISISNAAVKGVYGTNAGMKGTYAKQNLWEKIDYVALDGTNGTDATSVKTALTLENASAETVVLNHAESTLTSKGDSVIGKLVGGAPIDVQSGSLAINDNVVMSGNITLADNASLTITRTDGKDDFAPTLTTDGNNLTVSGGEGSKLVLKHDGAHWCDKGPAALRQNYDGGNMTINVGELSIDSMAYGIHTMGNGTIDVTAKKIDIASNHCGSAITLQDSKGNATVKINDFADGLTITKNGDSINDGGMEPGEYGNNDYVKEDDGFVLASRSSNDGGTAIIIDGTGDVTLNANHRAAAYVSGTNGSISVRTTGNFTATGTSLASGENLYEAEKTTSTLFVKGGKLNIEAGKIVIADKGAQNKAIEVGEAGELTLTGGEGSTIDGRVQVASGATATLTGDITFADQTNSTDNTFPVIQNKGTLTVEGATFSNNKATISGGTIYGGAISSWEADTTLTNVTFSGNTVTTDDGKNGSGGALYARNGKVTVTGGSFEGNYSGKMGGAVYLASSPDSKGEAIFKDVQFIGNKSRTAGAGVVLNGNNTEKYTATFEKVTFKDNIAGGDSGAVYVYGATANIKDSTFTGNQSTEGGAIRNWSVVNFDGTNTFSGNIANGVGNDIYNSGTINVLGGTTTLNSGFTQAAGASTNITDGTFAVYGDLDIAGSSVNVNKGGTFIAMADEVLDSAFNAIKDVADAVKGYFGNVGLDLGIRNTDGTVTAGEYTLAQYETAKSGVLADVDETAEFSFLNASVKVEGIENVVIGGTEVATVTDEDGGTYRTTEFSAQSSPTLVKDGMSVDEAPADASSPENFYNNKVVITESTDESHTALNVDRIHAKDAKFDAGVLVVGKDSGKNGVVELVINGNQNGEGSYITISGYHDGPADADHHGIVMLDDDEGTVVDVKVKVEAGSTFVFGHHDNTELEQSAKIAEAEVSGNHIIDGNGAHNTHVEYDKVSMKSGNFNLLDTASVIGKLDAKGGRIYIDPAYVNIHKVEGDSLASELIVGSGSVVEIGAADSGLETIVKEKGWTTTAAADNGFLVSGDKAVLSLLGQASALKIDGTTGYLAVDPSLVKVEDGATYKPAGNIAVTKGGAYFAPSSLLVVDGANVATGAAIAGAGTAVINVAEGAELYIRDAKADQQYTIAEGFKNAASKVEGWTKVISNYLTEANAELTDDGKVIIAVDQKDASEALPGVIPANALNTMMTENTNSVADEAPAGVRFLSRAVEPEFLAENKAVGTINEVSRAAVTAGVQNTSLRIADAASNTVVDHMSLSQHGASSSIHADGVDFWAAPMYGNLYTSGMNVAGSSVRGQFGGLALGADLEAGQFLGGKFRLGAAINGGGGQSETKGSATSTQNDYDFGGLNFYAGWNSGALNIIGSVGYGFGNHEVEMGLPVAGMNSAKADIDTTVFTADLRAEYQLKTDWVDILPHAGIRYTALKTDAHDLKSNGSVLNSVKSDTQNIVQFPVGVTISKDFDLSGWNVKPMADISVIPAAGEKKATTKVNFSGMDAWDSVNSRIMDSTSWSGTVGVQAEKGNMTFGLNYGVQASSNETDQNIQVKFGWKF